MHGDGKNYFAAKIYENVASDPLSVIILEDCHKNSAP